MIPSPTGRLLTLLRRAAAVSREEAAVTLGVHPRRIGDLELGRGQPLGYFESRDLAKLYLLCPNCFYRLMDAARDREIAELAGATQTQEVEASHDAMTADTFVPGAHPST